MFRQKDNIVRPKNAQLDEKIPWPVGLQNVNLYIDEKNCDEWTRVDELTGQK